MTSSQAEPGNQTVSIVQVQAGKTLLANAHYFAWLPSWPAYRLPAHGATGRHKWADTGGHPARHTLPLLTRKPEQRVPGSWIRQALLPLQHARAEQHTQPQHSSSDSRDAQGIASHPQAHSSAHGGKHNLFVTRHGAHLCQPLGGQLQCGVKSRGMPGLMHQNEDRETMKAPWPRCKTNCPPARRHLHSRTNNPPPLAPQACP